MNVETHLTAGETGFTIYIGCQQRDTVFRRSNCPGILAFVPTIRRTDLGLYIQLTPAHAHPDGIKSKHAEVSRQRKPNSFEVTGYTVTLPHNRWGELVEFRSATRVAVQTVIGSDGSVLIYLPLPRETIAPADLRGDLLDMLGKRAA